MVDCNNLSPFENVPAECRPVRVFVDEENFQDDETVVEHDWERHGWAAFNPVTITVDGAQVFVGTVASGLGVLTGTQAGAGSHRVAYLRSGTRWRDSEITSVVFGPAGTAWNGTNAQQGHLHRVRPVSGVPGMWEGIAIWTAVFGGGYELINTRGVRFDGATLFQSGGDAASSGDAGFIDRSLIVDARQRLNFGSWLNQYRAIPMHLNGLKVGTLVTIANVSGTGFDQTDIAVNAVDPATGLVQVIDPTDTTTVAWGSTPTGTVIPSGASAPARYVPFAVSSRVEGDDPDSQVVAWKRWKHLYEDEPDWGSQRVQRKTITSNVDVPDLAVGSGHCALWGAHFHDGSAGTWGGATFRRTS